MCLRSRCCPAGGFSTSPACRSASAVSNSRVSDSELPWFTVCCRKCASVLRAGDRTRLQGSQLGLASQRVSE